MISSPIKTLWPAAQSINLGNFLTFRKEVELLSSILKRDTGTIYFEGLPPEKIRNIAFIEETLLCSSLPIDIRFEVPRHEQIDWPLTDKEMTQWCYGSFKRVEILSMQAQLFPLLLWPQGTLEAANALYARLSPDRKSKLITIHLKRQTGGAEESNATLENWLELFALNQNMTFLLLGHDPIPSDFFALSNVFHADHFKIPLSVQLALCSVTDAFMGMASGICNAACLSRTPYTIFKHPEHHVKEMDLELGNNDYLSFALPNQKLWRKMDSLENLALHNV